MKVTMAWADIDATSQRYVQDVLKSGWLSRRKYIPRFEHEIAKLQGQKVGVMVNSGTDALRIGLLALKEIHRWPDGSEVVIPAVTFIATANAVLQAALKPTFVDVDGRSFNLDAEKLNERITARTCAVLAVHLFGRPADLAEISKITKKRGVVLVEDSCESLGVHEVQGEWAAFSTYMAHMVQTGIGGVLTTNNPQIEEIARSLMNHGRTDNPDKFEFERVGYSSRITELEAALGCAQLKRLPQILEHRKAMAWKLWEDLHDFSQLQMPLLYRDSSWMLFPMILLAGHRDKFMSYMKSKGIETRQMMPLINQKRYRDQVKLGEFPIAEWINERGVCLPCHQKLTNKQVDYMIQCVKGFFKLKR